MCDEKKGCQHPEKLKGGKPSECSPEQIAECHGTTDEHPCESSDDNE